MKEERVKILFIILIALAIVGGAFIYFYRSFGNEIVQRYIEKITICENITVESICLERKSCEGIYGPTEFSGKNQFLECKTIPPHRLSEMQSSFALCQETGGRWHENKLGKFCLCDSLGTNKIFDKEKGCVNK